MNITMKILILMAVLSIPAGSAHATELKVGNDLVINKNSASREITTQSRIDMLSKPYDDVKLSDDVSAGFISGRDDYSMDNQQRLPVKKKGREVGVGISLSF